MTRDIDKTHTARLLSAFICHADANGQIEKKNAEFFSEINALFPNGNILDRHLYDLNNSGLISYEEIGEDGFAPIIIAGWTKRTAEHLSKLLVEIDTEVNDLKHRLQDILTFDPERLKSEIVSAENQLKAARKSAEENELLRPLLRQISDIEKHFQGVSAVAEKYEDIYKNIIRPVQLEGESGIKATVRWAIISIFASTVISLALGSWKDILEIFKNIF